MPYFLNILLLLSLLVGCAGHAASDRAEIETGSPVVYIHPMTADLGQASVVILPFNVPPGIDIREGEKVGALFQDVLLGKQAFRTVKMVNQHYGTLDEAARLAGEAGADLALAGKIQYLLSGAKLGEARVDVSVRVIDVRSGNTVWYIEQTVDQRLDYPDLSFKKRLADIFSTPALRSSEGAPTVPNMLVHIALDISDVMAGSRAVAKM
ncbi:MAG: hypothetical protein KQH63_12470 [Desulfobulbaceae bacterium]|nr:hypothetical protein [Desulfobulbaceae bacterium]